ncbi:tRNA lysidine(34) synthetase TilS [Aliidiomarina minuta]|uniref:tRNA(Ile)-lysidine synthase n=1 Tax=Aliidiomarina minuta TaxID=880057 RepID=A0A432W7K8_9GAMM|nr:tRNA lysidine(34) synthetase TilS [Aliidiomarina minuta]RUO26073.1 tRNA lysidine(34) synthetase TilS [Aliidiomarina minuta]
MNIVDDLYASYCSAIQALQPEPGQQLVVALGGGADSQSVLDLTLRYREQHPELNYLAIHLDHFFHPDSPQWAEFLRDYCASQDMPAIVESLPVDLLNRHSKEAQGRSARYRRLAELTDDNAIILLGQHLSDQAETFLLQLKRGSGPKGLAAMAAQAPFTGQRRLCRPLLGHNKEQIIRYASTREVPWIEDDTNLDTSIDRNFLRHDVVPLLRQRWPQFEQVVARSAKLCAEQQELLDSLLQNDLKQRACGHCFQLTQWQSLSLPHRSALLRAWLQQCGASMPSQSVMQNLLQQTTAAEDANIQVRWGQQQLRRYQNELYLLPLFADLKEYYQHWDGESELQLPDNLGSIVADPQQGDELAISEGTQLSLRLLQPGDKFRGQGREQSRSLSRSLGKVGVKPWERQRWPVLVVAGQIAWTPQLGVNADYQPESPLRYLHPVWLKDSGASK